MASLREIRRKIKSVKSTEQITKAMKMVAAARMRKSQLAILAARPFAAKMERMVRELALLQERDDAAAGLAVSTLHPFFQKRAEGAELVADLFHERLSHSLAGVTHGRGSPMVPSCGGMLAAPCACGGLRADAPRRNGERVCAGQAPGRRRPGRVRDGMAAVRDHPYRC